jgi:hypothetical protein
VSECARACVRVCVCACACACVRVRVCVFLPVLRMLLTCIRVVVLSNQDCNTDLPTDVLHRPFENLVENAALIRVIKLMCSKNI